VSSTPVNLVSSRGSSPQPNTNLQLTVAAAPSTTARVPLLSRTPASSAKKKKKKKELQNNELGLGLRPANFSFLC